MTRERELEILMADGCTRSEAEKHLDNGSIIYEDFKENIKAYTDGWEDVEIYEKMIKDQKPIKDWGIVKLDGKTYYIEYFL